MGKGWHLKRSKWLDLMRIKPGKFHVGNQNRIPISFLKLRFQLPRLLAFMCVQFVNFLLALLVTDFSTKARREMTWMSLIRCSLRISWYVMSTFNSCRSNCTSETCCSFSPEHSCHTHYDFRCHGILRKMAWYSFRSSAISVLLYAFVFSAASFRAFSSVLSFESRILRIESHSARIIEMRESIMVPECIWIDDILCTLKHQCVLTLIVLRRKLS